MADRNLGYRLLYQEGLGPGDFNHLAFTRTCALRCPLCHVGLTDFLLYDRRDPRIDFAGLDVPHVPFLNCCECNLYFSPLEYRISPSGGIALISHETDIIEHEWTHLHARTPPQRVSLTELPPTLQSINQRLNAGEELSDWENDFALGILRQQKPWAQALDVMSQIGGQPFFLGARHVQRCPDCREEMRLVLSLANDQQALALTVESGQLCFHFCAACLVVRSSYWS